MPGHGRRACLDGRVRHPNNDRLIFSKGHASPLLYAMYKAAGVITDEELMSLRKFGSRLEGHPKPLQSAEKHGAPHGLPSVWMACDRERRA